MADVVIPLTGSGDTTKTVATDTIAGREHQEVKIEFGVAGAATLVSSTNPLPVDASLSVGVVGVSAASANTIVTVRSDTYANLLGRVEGGRGATEGVTASGVNPLAMGGYVQATTPSSFANGQVGKVWLGTPGTVNVTIRSATGAELGATNPLPVDASFSTAVMGVSAASSNTHVGVTPTGGAAQAVTAVSASFTAAVTPSGGAAQAVTSDYGTFSATVIAAASAVFGVSAASANTHVGVTPTSGATWSVTAASATFTAGVTPTAGASFTVNAVSATFSSLVTASGAAAQAVTAASATFTTGVTPTAGATWSVTAASATFTAGVTPTAGAIFGVSAASANYVVKVNATGNTVKSITAISATSLITGSACTFYGGIFHNTGTPPVYIQCFSVSAASDVTLGTTAPTIVISVPAAATAANGATVPYNSFRGIAFAKGLAVAATTTPSGATLSTIAAVGFFEYQ